MEDWALHIYIFDNNMYKIDGASWVVLVAKNPPVNAGDVSGTSSTPVSRILPKGGHGSPLHYSCLENPKDKEAWRTTVHGVTKSQIQRK